MCGLPYHTYENYMNRLVEKSYKVAICEQVENPKIAKGLVKREVLSEDTKKGKNLLRFMTFINFLKEKRRYTYGLLYKMW